MPRQLVVCLDGTGNRFSQRPTNVLRVVRALPKNTAQTLVYYDEGVGTFGLKETLFEWQKLPARVCGLAFGWGLRRIVEGAYRFLAENMQPGDQIFIFGFSRGAFAARALAALVHSAGLVPRHAGHLFDAAWSLLLARSGPEKKPDFELMSRFKSTFSQPARVHFLGLFDTVKSVGWVYDPVAIPFTANNSSVNHVRHAVSIDERRCFFRQHLWSDDARQRTCVKEVWFAGVHSDVGGGYPPTEAALALMAYRWMVAEALACGLVVDGQELHRQLNPADGTRADANAGMHDSMGLAWKFAEWAPRLVWKGPGKGRRLSMGAMPPLRQPRPRVMDRRRGVLVHEAVRQRLAACPQYQPANWPADQGMVRFVDDDPAIAPYL